MLAFSQNYIAIMITFLLKNCKSLLHCKSYSHFFFNKNGRFFLRIIRLKINVSLTNDVVSFEKAGPDVLSH